MIQDFAKPSAVEESGDGPKPLPFRHVVQKAPGAPAVIRVDVRTDPRDDY